MKSPFISLVLPVYNVQAYIERCVESIVHQDYEDYEVILVDDGSTDESGCICDELSEKYSNVTALHKENGGLGSARNYGMQYVRGEYVVFIDSDDWVADRFLKTIDSYLRTEKPDVLKYGYRQMKDGVPGKTTVPYYAEGLYRREKIETVILPGAIGPIRLFDYSRNALLSAWACAYSMKFLRENELWFESEREILNEDYLFNIAVLLNANSVRVTHEVLYMYDYRGGSLSKRYVQRMPERKLRLLGRYKSLLEDKSLFETYSSAYYAQCVDSFYACISNECGQWADESRSIMNIREILNIPECAEALRRCNHSALGLKGTIIYWLMRAKQPVLIYFLYRTVRKVV